MSRMFVALVLALALALPSASFAAAPRGTANSGPDAQSARQFVQNFYDWYVKAGQRMDVALQEEPGWFSSKILAGLRDDLAAQAKDPDDVVGIDFDPFLNAQETYDPYTTCKVTAAGLGFRIEVSHQGACADGKDLGVIAAVEKRKGKWVFTDFYYPGQGDLFSALAQAKKEREKAVK